MQRTVLRLFLSLLAPVIIGLAALALFRQPAAIVQAAQFDAAVPQANDNAECLDCHSTLEGVHTFANGDTIALRVAGETYSQGVHASVACQVCHTNLVAYPHPANPAQSAREYTLQYADTCKQCHPGQAEQVLDSAHTRLAEQGNPNTPVCADCHDPHAQAKIEKDANGDPAAAENVKIASTCEKCHAGIVGEYKESVHGQGVFGENNPDVPACHDCHGIHNIATARSDEFRLNSPGLCSECHTRRDIMDQYGISTDVMDTYVSDFHGTTVVLFERTSPELPTNKPVCYDCHGIHDIARTDDPEKGLQIKTNMLATCQKCHPDATENFPESWMSHYIASPDKFPLVFYVQWFYRLFIPAVIGGMGIFVLSDILRKTGLTRRKQDGGEVKDGEQSHE